MIKAAVPRGESAEKYYAQVGEGYAGAKKTEEREIVLGECGCRRREREARMLAGRQDRIW
jgi:hypothetical protein